MNKVFKVFIFIFILTVSCYQNIFAHVFSFYNETDKWIIIREVRFRTAFCSNDHSLYVGPGSTYKIAAGACGMSGFDFRICQNNPGADQPPENRTNCLNSHLYFMDYPGTYSGDDYNIMIGSDGYTNICAGKTSKCDRYYNH